MIEQDYGQFDAKFGEQLKRELKEFKSNRPYVTMLPSEKRVIKPNPGGPELQAIEEKPAA